MKNKVKFDLDLWNKKWLISIKKSFRVVMGVGCIFTTNHQLVKWDMWPMIGIIIGSDSTCKHPRKLYILDDYNGFFWSQPCSKLSKLFSPFLQHDKAQYINNAASSLNIRSTLCNFHGLTALRTYINWKQAFKNRFTSPFNLVLRLSCVAGTAQFERIWYDDYISFITNVIPENLLDKEGKN